MDYTLHTAQVVVAPAGIHNHMLYVIPVGQAVGLADGVYVILLGGAHFVKASAYTAVNLFITLFVVAQA